LSTGSRDADRPEHPRTIRSFVLREGRITPAQQRAFSEHWARFGIDYVPS
jgi:tRNA (guanine-N7-)-methyltransferase